MSLKSFLKPVGSCSLNMRFLIIMECLCLLSAVPSLRSEELASSVVHRAEINILREKAIENTHKGMHDEAIRCYQRWAELDPEDPLVLKDLMWALWLRNRTKEAGTAARAIIKLRPRNMDALDMLARVPTPENRAALEQTWRYAVKAGTVRGSGSLPMYRKLMALAPEKKAFVLVSHFCSGLYRTGQFKEGVEVARYLVEQQPENPEAWAWLGRAQYASGNPDAAIISYKTSLKIKPDQPLILKDMMRAFWRSDRTEEAGAAARALIKIRPGNQDALDMLARVPTPENRAALEQAWRDAVKAEAGRNSRGLPMYRKLLALAPEKKAFALVSHFCSGLYRTGQYKEGLEVAQYLVKQQPKDPDAWNRLGRAQYSVGDEDSAIKSYETSLKIKPDQPLVSIYILRMYFDMRNFQGAARIAGALKREGKLPENSRLILAHSLFWTMRYKEALPLLQEVIRSAPESMNNHYYEALTLFMLGDEASARNKMRAIYARFQAKPALVFLIDYAHMRGDTADETAMLEKECAVLTPDDEAWVLRLSALYDETGSPDMAQKLLARFNDSFPDKPEVLLRLSEKALKQRNWDASAQFCKQALALNPYSEAIYEVMAEVESAGGHAEDSVRYLSKNLELNPTNPSNVLNLAQAAYEADRPSTAKKMIMDWLSKNKDSQVLTILLYHGLTTNPNDPLLFNTYHHSVKALDSQLKALHEAGYSSVTQKQVEDWLSGKSELPARPVLITFDDGRLDSFVLGDPVLKKYGMKAVMFATLVNSVDLRSPPGYLSLSGLKTCQDTGRWEIQSHGGYAHVAVPTSPDGDKGLFLINRRWLENLGRMETVEEWQDRIEKDYLYGRSRLEEAMGREITAFAFPQGAYGQGTDSSNVPESAQTNQSLVRKYYMAAYTQDAFGMNTRTRDPWHLTRLEPNHNWSGQELIRYLANNSPSVRFYKELLRWAYWEGRPYEAYKWLAELKKMGVSEGELLLEEARIHLASQNEAEGLHLARRAAALENIPAAVQIATSAYARGSLTWSPSADYDADNMGRSNWSAGQTLEVARTGPATWAARQEYSQHRQRGFETVKDNAGGAAVTAKLGLFQSVRAELLAHLLTGGGANTWSASAALESLWTDSLTTQLRLKRSPYDTAGALRENIRTVSADTDIDWSLDKDRLWRLSFRGSLNSLSDSNRRLTASGEISRAIPGAGWLRGFYSYSYDDMKRDRTLVYYSPRGVTSNSFGAEAAVVDSRQVNWTLRYMPAFASERGKRRTLEHEIKTSLIWRTCRRLNIRPTYSYFSAPGYISNSYSLEAQVRF